MNTSQELIVSPSSYRPIHIPTAQKELTIKDLLSVFVRRRAIVAATVVFFVAVAVVVCIFSTRRYSAVAELQVQKEAGSPLGLEGAAGEASGSYSDALQDNITLQTQASILQSDSLALKVIHDLKLADTDDFKPTFDPIGWVLGLFSSGGPSDTQLGPPDASDMGFSPRDRIRLLWLFEKNLKVKPVAGTRLIDISYLSSSPRMAAAIVNALVQGLSDYNFETHHDATARTAHYLTSQLAELRQQSERLQGRLARAQRDSEVVSLGGVDAQGREQVYSAALDKLQQATVSYTQAQSNRIAKEAVYQAAKTGDPEAISGLSGGTVFSASGSDGALGLIQSLRMQQATLQSELAETQAKFGPAFPKIDEMQQRLDALNASIKTEVSRVADRAKNDAEVARTVEENTRKVYVNLKTQADALNDKTIAYTLLRQEADQSRTLYETLFKQLKEAGVLADFKVSNISIVDPARVPAKPATPNIPLYLAAAVVVGILIGGCGALLRDALDSKIHSLPELEAQLGELPVGVLPYHDKLKPLRGARARALAGTPESLSFSSNGAKDPAGEPMTSARSILPIQHASSLAALNDSRSAYIEALRALRTSMLLARGGAPPKVILVTSSIAGEGKSMLSANLAAILSQQDRKILLIDGDLRRPTLHRTFNVPNVNGLSSFLAGYRNGPDSLGVVVKDLPNLTLLTAGPIPPYPAELLGSEQMRQALDTWRAQFDFILIDGSPVLPVTDAVVLSTMVDFTLLVARYDTTERQSLDRSHRLLQAQTERTQIGVVLNAVRRDSSTYYQYYGYKDSAYYGGKSYEQQTA